MLCKLVLLCFVGNILLNYAYGIREGEQYDRYNLDRIKEKLQRSGISEDIRTKIHNHDGNVFKNMAEKEFKKFTPDMIAAAGEDAIKKMELDQVSMMAEKLYQGDEKNLMKIFSFMKQDQLNVAIEKISEMSNKSEEQAHLNCVQFEPMILAMKRLYGKPQTWNKRIFDKMGKEFVQCLPPDDLMNVAGNKDVFRSMLNTMNDKKQDKHRATKLSKRSLLAAATTAFGNMKDWKADDLKSARSLVTMLKPKDLKELNPGVVKEALNNLGQEQWDEKRGKELVNKLRDTASGFGAVNTWTADTVKKLGNLRASLSKKELDELPDDTLRDSVKDFGRTVLPLYKKRALGKRLKTLYGHPRHWTRDEIKNASNLLGGIETRELDEIDNTALLEALPEVRDIKLPKHKARVLAKKIQQTMGDVQNWDINSVKQIGPLIRDLPSATLEMLNPNEAKEAIKMLRSEADVPKSKKRVLIKKSMSGGNQSRLPIKEFGDFVSEFPIRKLKNINNVDDILPTDVFDNSSDSDNVTDESMPHWRAVQARTLLGDVILKPEHWGPVSELSGNWELKNIKKLGRLSLGLKKSDIDKLSIDSFTDFVAEFSQISNWTLGQSKTIAKRFFQAYSSRESDMTVTDMSSLGDFVVHIIDEIRASLPTETAREAVRIIGTSRLYRRLPKAARQRKAKIALEILGKKTSTINSDELEDLGYLVSGFTAEEIGEISPTVFSDVLPLLGDIDELDNETTTALADKAVEVYGGAASIDGEILQDLGHIVEGLDSTDIAKIPAIVVEENIHVFAQAKLQPDKAIAVLEKTESAKRRRRAVDMSLKTASDLISMGSTVLALTPSEILSISNETFSDVVAEISEIRGFSTEQLQAWATKAAVAMGGPSMMTEDQLLSLNEFVKGFTPDELSKTSFTSNEVIESFGNIRGYTPQQIAKLWETIKRGKSMMAFTGDDLVALGVIATGMSTAELNSVDVVAYQDAALELGQLNEWSSDQLAALKEKAILSFGAINSWTPAEMSLTGAVIGSFTAQEIQSISADHLDAVAGNSLQHIPPETFKAFSVEQLSNMSGEQVAAITDEQKSALSSAQKTILMGIETATLGYTSGGAALGLSISHLLVHTVVFQVFMMQFISRAL